jgi:hypothetical protein
LLNNILYPILIFVFEHIDSSAAFLHPYLQNLKSINTENGKNSSDKHRNESSFECFFEVTILWLFQYDFTDQKAAPAYRIGKTKALAFNEISK